MEIDLDRAADFGTWRLLPENSQILAVHAALLHTDRVCFFAGSSNNPANLGSEFRGDIWNFGGWVSPSLTYLALSARAAPMIV